MEERVTIQKEIYSGLGPDFHSCPEEQQRTFQIANALILSKMYIFGDFKIKLYLC